MDLNVSDPPLPPLVAWALIALVTACPSCGSKPTAPAQGTTGKKFAEPVPGVRGIENFARIAPDIYRGGQPDAEGFQYLKSLGVRTIVNLRSYHSEKAQVEALGMASVEIPLQADLLGSKPPTEEEIARFFGVLLDPARRSVFVHCAHGKDRTGVMIALYRMERDGWTAEEAMEEMLAFGFRGSIYRALAAFVRSYKPRGFGK